MKSRSFVTGVHMFLILALVILLCSGCTGGTNNSKPPQIPPQSTFVMEFSDFTQSKSSFNPTQPAVVLVSYHEEAVPAGTAPHILGDRANWGFAALNVGFWNLVGVLGLAIPVASFVESVKQTPVRQPDNSWVWTYSITVQGITCTAELHGKYIADGVRWDMYITKQNEYTDFLWYYGESNSDNTRGYWVLKEKPNKPNDLLRIDWQRNPADETGDIKYTNIVPGGAENGGYISYTESKEHPYDRYYAIYNKGKNETINIEWNSVTKAGRVKDSVHFGNSNWHCWDTGLKNTVCPQ